MCRKSNTPTIQGYTYDNHDSYSSFFYNSGRFSSFLTSRIQRLTAPIWKSTLIRLSLMKRIGCPRTPICRINHKVICNRSEMGKKCPCLVWTRCWRVLIHLSCSPRQLSEGLFSCGPNMKMCCTVTAHLNCGIQSLTNRIVQSQCASRMRCARV
jgi:hypothetical protein